MNVANTISVGELRQNPTRMLREVKAGATYVITDHGEPVAEVAPRREQRWVPSAEVDALLRALGPDDGWTRDIADARAAEDAEDPWDSAR
jgi:prevent-host-death family protein